MALKTPSSEFVQGLKLELPNLSDKAAIDMYNKALDLNPEIAIMDQIQLGKNIAQVTKESLENYSKGSQAPAATMPGQVPQLNTELKSPFAGTAMAARNPDNPQSELMDQFDPQALRAAYADYAKKYDASLPARQVSTYFSARGSGGAQAVENLLKSQEDYNKYSTVDKQIAAADMAAKGVTNATALQNQAKTAGEYKLSQSRGQQELLQAAQKTETGGQQLALSRLLNTPGNDIAAEALMMAIEDYKLTHNEEPPQDVKEKWAKMSAAQLALFSPKFMERYKQFLDASKVGAEVTGAGQGQATVEQRGGAPVQQSPRLPTVQTPQPIAPKVAPVTGVPTPTPIGPTVPTPEQIKAQGLDPEVAKYVQKGMENPKVQQALTATNESLRDPGAGRGNVNPPTANAPTSFPIIQSAFENKKQTAPSPTGQWNDQLYGPKPPASQIYSTSVTAGPGGATVSEDSYSGQKKGQTAQELDNTQKFISNYDSTTRDNVTFALNNANDQYAGRLKQLGSKIVNDPIGQKMANATTSLNEAGRAAGIVPANAPGNAAGTVGAIGQVIGGIPNAATMATGAGLQALSTTMGQRDAVSAESPPPVIRDLAARVAIVKAQQQELLKYKRDYSQQLNKNLEGFTETPIYKKITDTTQMIPMLNPQSGKAEIVDRSDKDRLDVLLRAGFQPAAKFLLKGPGVK